MDESTQVGTQGRVEVEGIARDGGVTRRQVLVDRVSRVNGDVFALVEGGRVVVPDAAGQVVAKGIVGAAHKRGVVDDSVGGRGGEGETDSHSTGDLGTHSSFLDPP